jgi:hypothetical protein
MKCGLHSRAEMFVRTHAVCGYYDRVKMLLIFNDDALLDEWRLQIESTKDCGFNIRKYGFTVVGVAVVLMAILLATKVTLKPEPKWDRTQIWPRWKLTTQPEPKWDWTRWKLTVGRYYMYIYWATPPVDRRLLGSAPSQRFAGSPSYSVGRACAAWWLARYNSLGYGVRKSPRGALLLWDVVCSIVFHTL